MALGKRVALIGIALGVVAFAPMAITVSRCSPAQDLPQGIDPTYCRHFALPGGPWIEMTAQMSKESFHQFTQNLSESQVSRYGAKACRVQGLHESSTAYFETYENLFIRVEWADNQTTYQGTDFVDSPCAGE